MIKEIFGMVVFISAMFGLIEVFHLLTGWNKQDMINGIVMCLCYMLMTHKEDRGNKK